MNFISKNQIAVIKDLALSEDVVFCGSLGLVLNGLLKREVGDIDVITKKNYHKTNISNGIRFLDNEMNNPEHHSHKFMNGDDEILCNKLYYPFKNGVMIGEDEQFKRRFLDRNEVDFNYDEVIKVDVMYNTSQLDINYKEIEFNGVIIKVETPESAIKHKKNYIIRNKFIDSKDIRKHIRDLSKLCTDEELDKLEKDIDEYADQNDRDSYFL